MDRYSEVLKAAERLTLSKTQASVLVGGRSRLERLDAERKIRCVKTTDKKNGRWECNASDVLRYTVLTTKCS